MDKNNDYEVTIRIGASAKNYWGELSFVDRYGKPHLKSFDLQSSGSIQANILKAMIAALEVLQRPCMLVIHTTVDYLISSYQNNWISNWRENDWKKVNGGEIKNKELWQQLSDQMAKHSIKFVRGE